MGKWCLHASLFLGNKDMFTNYKRFDFWHVQMADIGGTKPWKNNCSLIWKLFKFLMTLLAGLFEMRGCWHSGLRWAIVALWATCSYLSWLGSEALVSRQVACLIEVATKTGLTVHSQSSRASLSFLSVKYAACPLVYHLQSQSSRASLSFLCCQSVQYPASPLVYHLRSQSSRASLSFLYSQASIQPVL